MRDRKRRRRVDWDEEVRKTERIRRRGFFISALGLGVAVLFTFGGGRGGVTEIGPKLLFAFFLALSLALCLALAVTMTRMASRERPRQEEVGSERPKRERPKEEEA
ncbi:MAG: hypothetical protein LBD04_00705 [Synergistaceae bacterium]|jgi:hypothetical protein|nr:hypothetical protein [Synergistaceae bacterium]